MPANRRRDPEPRRRERESRRRDPELAGDVDPDPAPLPTLLLTPTQGHALARLIEVAIQHRDTDDLDNAFVLAMRHGPDEEKITIFVTSADGYEPEFMFDLVDRVTLYAPLKTEKERR